MASTPPSRSRRTLAAALIGAPALWLGPRAQPSAPRRVTPAQTEGPFYPVQLPPDSDNDLLRNGVLTYGNGRPAWVEGSVSDLDGRPLGAAHPCPRSSSARASC